MAALAAYQEARLKPTTAVVRANRANPPDFINDTVERLTGDKPFEHLDAVITQDDPACRALSWINMQGTNASRGFGVARDVR